MGALRTCRLCADGLPGIVSVPCPYRIRRCRRGVRIRQGRHHRPRRRHRRRQPHPRGARANPPPFLLPPPRSLPSPETHRNFTCLRPRRLPPHLQIALIAPVVVQSALPLPSLALTLTQPALIVAGDADTVALPADVGADTDTDIRTDADRNSLLLCASLHSQGGCIARHRDRKGESTVVPWAVPVI